LGLLDTPTAGRIVIDGADATKLSESERTRVRNKKIGFVFQFFNLIPELKVSENVILPSLIRGDPRKKAEADATKILEQVGLIEKIRIEAPDE